MTVLAILMLTAILLLGLKNFVEKRYSVQAGLFFAFLGIILLGACMTASGGFYVVKAFAARDFAQGILNFIVMLMGLFCVLLAAKPFWRLIKRAKQ